MGKVFLGMVLGVLLLFVLLVFVGVVSSRKDSNGSSAESSTASSVSREEQEPRESQVAFTVTALKLWSDYQANEVAADNVYKGKQLLVEGVVNGISKDFADQIYVTLSTPNEFEGVHADIKSRFQSEAAALQRGQTIAVRCEGGGMVLASPVLRDCSIEPYASQASESQNLFEVPTDSTAPSDSNQSEESKPAPNITMPVLISQAPAQYTEDARRNNVSGTVELVLTVDEDGNPQNVKVAKSLGMGLDESAVDAVKHYKFRPAMDQSTGKPVPAQISVSVNFRLY